MKDFFLNFNSRNSDLGVSKKKGMIIYCNRCISETMGTFPRDVIPQTFFDTFNMAVQM